MGATLASAKLDPLLVVSSKQRRLLDTNTNDVALKKRCKAAEQFGREILQYCCHLMVPFGFFNEQDRLSHRPGLKQTGLSIFPESGGEETWSTI